MKRKLEPPVLDPWKLVWGQPYIDGKTLAAAIEQDLEKTPEPDFRTRLLIRDAARALESYWGPQVFGNWLAQSSEAVRIRAILQEKLGRPGFRHIRRRLVDRIGRDAVEQILAQIGARLVSPVEITIAGSLPTLLAGLTSRPTDGIDLVDEVPAAIRSDPAILKLIKKQYGLTLGHVQSHYLPANWHDRRTYFGQFGKLRVYLADPIDVFVSKLSSLREKHLDDLRVMAPQLDRGLVRERLLTAGQAFVETPAVRSKIEANWQFVFREPL